MAYFVDVAVTYLNGASTGAALNMPPHQAGDLLVLWVTADTGTFTISASSSTWATIASNTTQASITGSWTYLLAGSSNETISITTTDGWCAGVYCIRDVDQTTPINISNLGSAVAPTNPAKAASVSVTTTTNDCFVLYLLGSDLVATAAHSEPGVHHIISFDNAGTTATTSACQHAAWYIQRTAGATPAPSWTQSAMAAYARLTIAINNVSGGIIPAYIDDVSSPATTITNGTHYSTLNNVSFTTTLTSTAAINGKTVTGLAGAAQADLGINSFSSGISPAATLIAKTALQGYQMSLTGNRNWSTGLLMGSFIGATPKMGTFGIGGVSDGGVVVRFGSSATAWAAYQVAAKDAQPTTEVRSVWAIQPGYVGTAYAQGTAVSTTAVSHIQFLMNSPLFASQAVLSEVYQVFTQIVSGGTESNPVDSDGLAKVGKSFRLPVIQKSGGAGIISYAPIQIGGGDAVNFQIDAGSLQFPKRYNVTTKDISFHVADNAVGISYAGKSGDVIKHTNSVISSATPFYWEINAAATNAATWDFAGTTIVNAAVTLRNVMTFNGMSFSACKSLNASGSSVINSNIKLAPTADNSLTVTSTSSITNSTFDTTLIPSGVGMTSLTLTTGVPISNCVFNGSSTSGHAIIITQAGTYAFNNLTFNGYGGTPGDNATPSSGSTSAVVYNNSGGAVIIQSSGGSFPSVRNGAGATTDVQGSATVELTGLALGTEIRAYVGTDPATSVQIAAIDDGVLTDTTWSFTQSYSGQSGYIQIFNVNYQPVWLNINYTGSNVSIPIQQITDRNYQP